MAFYTCFYCMHSGNKSTHHNEHFLPRSTGHTRTVDSCRECNWQKGKKSALAYAKWLRDHPDQLEPGTPHSDSDRRPFVRQMLGLGSWQLPGMALPPRRWPRFPPTRVCLF